ncbi:uncharacterized protein LOC144101908 [Amblyomma americanum]
MQQGVAASPQPRAVSGGPTPAAAPSAQPSGSRPSYGAAAGSAKVAASSPWPASAAAAVSGSQPAAAALPQSPPGAVTERTAEAGDQATPGDDVTIKGPCDGRNMMHASWTSAEGNARPRKQIRLSDFMPVMADSSLPLSSTGPSFRKSPRASPCEEDMRAAAASAEAAEADESLDATLVVNGSEASQSDDSVSVESASSSSTMTPENATNNRSPSDGRPARAAEPDLPEALLRRLEDMINERARHMEAYLQQVHIQLILMQHMFMGEIQTMLQEVLDEVLVLLTIIDEMREPI